VPETDKEPINYWDIPNSAINVTHEISFLATERNIRSEELNLQHPEQYTRLESKVRSQIKKRKQAMQALDREIENLEDYLDELEELE